MRFFSNGPDIPDILLQRRDQGRVVFLCGAGVSLNSGMPSFPALTKYVIDFFDPPEESEITKVFLPWKKEFEAPATSDEPKVPLDQIFNLLHQEYGRNEVNALVAERLQHDKSSHAASNHHELISRISADLEGNPQLVTTNFDRLFETIKPADNWNIHEPPALPDIKLGIALSGITYLHGRLQNPNSKHHPYILGSADFGRAYLSEAWATNFIRSLLEHYTVVLVGYSAEDPPVKYLLQGLNHDETSNRSNLYAFDKGLPEEVEAKWRDKGITAISYQEHANLWESIEAWAIRADDPRKWRQTIAELGQCSPSELTKHQRGQVAHLVRTTPGAKLFTNTVPAPTAEWLCVFDAYCRTAKESSNYGEDSETFDPLGTYGLDNDPPRPPEPHRSTPLAHDHLLEWRHGDTNPVSAHRLSGPTSAGENELPPRLRHLSWWIVQSLNNPIAAWWALRQNGLHSRLVDQINWQLRHNNELHLKARHIWRLIIEMQSDAKIFSRRHDLFDLKKRIQHEGWTARVLREFKECTAPSLAWTLPSGISRSKPPTESWDEIYLNLLANWEVKFPEQHGDDIDIPDDIVEGAFRALNDHLYRAIELLNDIETTYYRSPTCYPEREVDGRLHYHDDGHAFFVWIVELFQRLSVLKPEQARSHATIWPKSDNYFFIKLKLFALNHPLLFSAIEAASNILELNQETFWDSGNRRELLFLLHDRWSEFGEANRAAITDRLLNGPDNLLGRDDGEYEKFRKDMACSYTSWLVKKGLELPHEQKSRLDLMIDGIPDWSDDWVTSLATENQSLAYTVKTDESPDTIIDLPLNEVLEGATKEHKREFGSHTEKRPFAGLVKANPRKALASLSLQSRSGEYPEYFWDTLISQWPEKTKPRLYRIFLHRLLHLPNNLVQKIRHTVGRWFQHRLLEAYQFDNELAWRVFDTLTEKIISGGEDITRSGIGETRVAGEIVHKSRRTYEYAINGPIGEAVKGVFSTLDSLKLDQNQQIPDEFKTRLERLINVSDEGGDHAVNIITHQIRWLFYLDPKWVIEQVTPWFNFEHHAAEPAWSGFLSTGKIPEEEIRSALKPYLPELFPQVYQWGWDHHHLRISTHLLIWLAIFRKDEPDGLSAHEMRQCLRNMSDSNRQDAISLLGQIGKDNENGWTDLVTPFIDSVWPRERAFRTTSLAYSWVSLLDDTEDDFPSVLNTVRQFLVPLTGDKYWLYRFHRDADEKPSLTAKYPESTLELLDASISDNLEEIPNDLQDVLDQIEESEPTLVNDLRYMRLLNLVDQL
jgi:hypothetical protein